ncbi:unnamed protein product [Vitrella brassicaformis CCMP3155]|uniref:SSD domain-containing protein n=1 Tax=Vitrella brassicaformis (strain CCMP3155) TaxID=1169540 RepID=A0A0G4H7I4_VITBC|nr:unnamed protein product [Vitrella brassicaformis CCMP3155]|eukprot:CEM39628.1 unnamed protein product [Vitrella brassicaformis CCMP3155]
MWMVAKAVVRRPGIFLLASVAVLGAVLLVGGLTTLPIRIESDFHRYLVTDGEASLRQRQLDAAVRVNDEGLTRRRRLSPHGEEEEDRSTLTVIYSLLKGSGNVYADSTSLAHMRSLEDRLVEAIADSGVCGSRGDKSCIAVTSALDYFYGRPVDYNSSNSNSNSTQSVYSFDARGDAPLDAAPVMDHWATRDIGWYCDKSFDDGRCLNGRTEFATIGDKETYDRAAGKALLPLLQGASWPGVRVLYSGDGVTAAEVREEVWGDVWLAVGSLLFVLVYLALHTWSLLLSTCGLVMVLTSVPLAYVLFVWLGPDQMMILNFLGVFVVTAIGADDLFVLSDLWSQSRLFFSSKAEEGDTDDNECLARRWLWTMRRGGGAVVVTSLTTAASFFANMASAVAPVREFGLFMGLCVLSACVLVLGLYPLVLVMCERLPPRLSNKPLNLFRRATMSQLAARMRARGDDQQLVEKVTGGEWPRVSPQDLDKPLTKESGFRATERFFHNVFYPFVYRFRVCLVVLGLVLVLVANVLVWTLFAPADTLPAFFPAGHNLDLVQHTTKEFRPSGKETPAHTGLLYVCAPGWRGEGCAEKRYNCRADDESQDDQRSGHGSCLASGVCRCIFGWEGEDCATRTTPPEPLQCRREDYFACGVDRGLCVDSTCACTDPSYHGHQCQLTHSDDAPKGVEVASFALLPPVSDVRLKLRLQLDPHLEAEGAGGRGGGGGEGGGGGGGGEGVNMTDVDVRLDQSIEGRKADGWVRPSFSLAQVYRQLQRRLQLDQQSSLSVGVSSQETSKQRLVDAARKGQVLVLARILAPQHLTHEIIQRAKRLNDRGSALVFSGAYRLAHLGYEDQGIAAQRGYGELGPAGEALRRRSREAEAESHAEDLYRTQKNPTLVEVVWGLGGLRRVGPFAKDEPIYDASFSLNTPEAQNAILDMCRPNLHGGAMNLLRVNHINCWMEVFMRWLNKNKLSFPVPAADLPLHVNAFLRDHPSWAEDVGMAADGSIKWTRVGFRCDVPNDMAASRAAEYGQLWETYAKEREKFAPTSLQSGYVTSRVFVRAETQRELVMSTLHIWVISTVCAAAGVFLFTGSVLLSLYLLVTVACIVMTLLAFMLVVMGWQFGVLEAIAVIIFIGLSVDYGLHLALSYREPPHRQPHKRVRDALTQTGISILAAAGTTLGSCAFLFFCTIRLFVQFGIVVFANTTLSLLFALLFFAALLAIAGPERVCSFSLGALLCCQWSRVCTTHPQPHPHRERQDGHQDEDEECGKRSAAAVGVAPCVLGKRVSSECGSGGVGEDDGGPTRAVSMSLAEDRMDSDGGAEKGSGDGDGDGDD